MSGIESSEDPTGTPERYTVNIQQTATGWTVDPSPLQVEPDYGEDGTMCYIKWYIVQPTTPANVTFDTSQGISFATPPSGMTVTYNAAATTASVNWANNLAAGAADQSFNYSIYLMINNVSTQIDPVVEDEAPPGVIFKAPSPGIRKPRGVAASATV